jgi:hypothetical protein
MAWPPIAHALLGVSVTAVCVNGRRASPSTETTASETRSTSSRFSSGLKTPSITLMSMKGTAAPLFGSLCPDGAALRFVRP